MREEENENEEKIYIEAEEDRQKFVRGVHTIWAVMLCVNIFMIAVAVHIPPIRWVFTVQFVTFYLFIAVFVIFYLVILHWEWLRREPKVNICILIAFTLIMGLMLATTAVYVRVVHGTFIDEVLIAITGLFLVAVGMAVMSTYCHFLELREPTMYICATLIVVVFGVVTLALIGFLAYTSLGFLNAFLAILFVLFFAMFMVCDTIRMMRDRHCCAPSPEEHVYAALTLWTDICRPCVLCLYRMGLLRDPCEHEICVAAVCRPPAKRVVPVPVRTDLVIAYP